MSDMNGIDEIKLKAAIDVLKETIGREDAERLEAALKDRGGFGNMNISEKEMKMVKTVIENPEMLRMILSTKQAREGLSKILKGM